MGIDNALGPITRPYLSTLSYFRCRIKFKKPSWELIWSSIGRIRLDKNKCSQFFNFMGKTELDRSDSKCVRVILRLNLAY